MATVKKPTEIDARKAFTLLFAGAALLYCTGLGALDLWAPDEPRYAAVAEELRSGRHGAAGLVLLHLNGEPYDQKPPLYFWLAAVAGHASGRVDELAARLPSALAGAIAVALTFAIGRLLRLPGAAPWLAAGLLATSFRFAFSARRAQLDVLLCACELAAIAIFLLLETRRGGSGDARCSPGLLLGFHAALGAAALVKGPVGWLPLLVIAAFLALERRASEFRALWPVWSPLVSLAPLAVWITTATALAPAGFARDAIGTNVFARFFAGTSHARPFYYYAYQLPLDFLPWTPLALIAAPTVLRLARRALPARPEHPADLEPRFAARFLAVWTLVPLAFFSLSAGKRGLYLLPIFPALALAATLALSSAKASRRLALAIGGVAAIELALALLALPRLDAEKSPRPIAQAAADALGAKGRLGVVGLRPLEGGLVHYGAPEVVSLADEPATRAFLAEGMRDRTTKRLILLRASEFERLRAPLALEQVAGFRSGRRALVLARSQGPERLEHPARAADPGR